MSVVGAEAGITQANRPPRPRRRTNWTGLFYVLPAVAFVVVFFLTPLVMTAWMSLHRWPLIGVISYVGFDNYIRMWSDQGFWNSLGFTVYYTVVVTITLFGTAFPLALFVEKPRAFAGFYRTAYFLPVVIGFASASLLWAWLSNVDSGLFSRLAEEIGLTGGRVNLLAGFQTAFWSIIVMVTWKMSGFFMIILMSGIQSIPPEYIEAATIDGANARQRLRFITLPLMRRPIALALVLSVAGSMLAFDQFYIILSGGPRNQTITAVYWIFNQSFVSFRLGYGSALSMVLLVILVALSLLQLWFLRDKEGTA